MKILALIEDHPYASGGVVFGVGLVVIFWMMKGNSGEQPAVSSSYQSGLNSAIAANNQTNAGLVQAQLAAQVAARQSDNQLASEKSDNAAALAASKLQFEMQNNANVLNAQVALRGFDTQDLKSTLTAQTTQHADTLNAQVASQTIQASLQEVLQKQGYDYKLGNQTLSNAALKNMLDVYGARGGDISVSGPGGINTEIHASAAKTALPKVAPPVAPKPKPEPKPEPFIPTPGQAANSFVWMRRPHHGEGGAAYINGVLYGQDSVFGRSMINAALGPRGGGR